MGLDMYLNKKTSVQSFWLQSPKMKEAGLEPKIILEDFPTIDVENITHIEEQVGTWRKCPAIHNWFVINAQDGEDNCKSYEIGEDMLSNLLEICEKIWDYYEENQNNHGQPNEKAKEFAEENLPNAPGFFFGSQEYSKDYFHWQIKNTIDMLKPISKTFSPNLMSYSINNLFFSWYTYQSSW